MYKAVRDAGINFFDCANEYNKGVSEEILGRLTKGHRDDLVLTTKVNAQIRPDINARGTSRRHVVQAVDLCLKRLQTDRIDVLFLHRYDAMTPIDESMRGLEDLVRAGKVIYPAVSNWSAWQTQRAIDLQERANWARLQVIQPMYSLVKRQAEVEILPMAEHNGIGVIPYSPAAAGLLSGKYLGQATGPAGKTNKMYEARYGDAWMFEVAEEYVAFCKERGLHPVSTAIAWVGAHPGGHRAHHRRAQCRAAQGLARRREDRHDPEPARGDRRPLPHAGAGHRSVGRAEGREGLKLSRKVPPSWDAHTARPLVFQVVRPRFRVTPPQYYDK